MQMVSCDGGIGAMTFRLGRQRVNEQPAEQSSHGGHDQEQPRTQMFSGFSKQRRLSTRRTRMVTNHPFERKVKNDLARREKDDGPDPRKDAHHQRQAEEADLRAKPSAAEFQEFREPAQRM